MVSTVYKYKVFLLELSYVLCGLDGRRRWQCGALISDLLARLMAWNGVKHAESPSQTLNEIITWLNSLIFGQTRRRQSPGWSIINSPHRLMSAAQPLRRSPDRVSSTTRGIEFF